jgi:ABC-type uncharacterized transport system substrate-binding protein
MQRRKFLFALGGAVSCPQVATAQQERSVRRVGVLTGNSEADVGAQTRVQAFRKRLADLGWAEGRNILVDVRWPGPDVARQEGLASDLVAQSPDVIMATSTRTTQALRAATRTIPIVFVGLSDPVATRVVSNLSRPEANVTGFMLYEHSFAGKWLGLLKDAVPSLARLAVFFNPDTAPYAPHYVQAAQEAGERVGVRVHASVVPDVDAIEPTIAALAGANDTGLLVIPDGGFIALNNARVSAAAAKYRVPTIYAVRLYVSNGGLMSYGADLTDQFRDGATYVDRVLRGARPVDLPVRFATKFELVINLKVATALGLTLPRRLVIGAELIQ